jgi:superfamily II DNA or RNA helicase
MKLIVSSPEEFKELGLSIEQDDTLVGTPEFKNVEAYLLDKISKTQELQDRPPRPYQLRYACIGCVRPNNLFAHEQGVGKCLAKGTSVLMFDGTTKLVEDVKVGDQVMGPDSKPRNVLTTTSGTSMMYKVTPTKGDSYVVNEDHILSLRISGRVATNRAQGWAGFNNPQSGSSSYQHGDIINISVKEYLKQSVTFKNRALGYRTGVEFKATPVPIDPYILGLWLGDGTSSRPTVTTADSEIVTELQTYCSSVQLNLSHGVAKSAAREYYLTNNTLARGRKGSNAFLSSLRDLQVLNNKHIPQLYKANSKDVRLELLAGLIDSDGHLTNNCFEIACKPDSLAEDILYLARSLGFAAYKKHRVKTCVNTGVPRVYNILTISGDTDLIPTRLRRKQATPRFQKKDVLVTGISVESVGIGEYYGFSVDGDHLFLLGDFTVTHNSYAAALMILGIYKEQLSELKPGSIHIIAPKHTLNLVWKKKELAKAGLDKFSEVIDGERTARLSKAPIWIYHYDLLKKQTERGRKSSRSNSHQLYKVFRKRYAPNFLIIDEVHRLKVGTQRTHAVKELRKKAKRVLGLTGTPMDGWVEHLASILGVIYKDNSVAFPYTPHSFAKKFTRVEVVSKDFATGEEGTKSTKKRPAPGIAADQVPAFHTATKHLIHRVTFRDKEVSPHVHFPATDSQVLIIDADEAHKEYYLKTHSHMLSLIQDAIAEMDKGLASRMKTRQNVLTHLNTLRAAANHPWEMNLLTPLDIPITNKMLRAVEICKAATNDSRKTIIYTNRIATGNRLVSALTKAGMKTTRIYDQDKTASPKKLSQLDRDLRIEEFQEDNSINVLVGNLDLMSEGLTLVEASVVIHHDHDWKSVSWSQGNNRVVRPGQSYDPVPVYDLVTKNTVDKYIYDAMIRKAKATARTIDKEFDSEESVVIDPLEVARNMIKELT